MSTLAVCGVNSRENHIEFNEFQHDIKQHFLNEYEESKFKAELLLRKFIASDGRAYIYRSGNVTGHSKTAKFMYNSQDNRLVQFLRSILHLKKLPKAINETITLTPVDQVVSGILLIQKTDYLCNGTFHVESSHQLPLARLFGALVQHGFSFEKTDKNTFTCLYTSIEAINNPTIQLGAFWARRPNRNIQFNHTYTQTILEKQGHYFSVLLDRWLYNFFEQLINRGILTQHIKEKEYD